MIAEGRGKKRTYIVISSSSEDDGEGDPEEDDESEEESSENADQYEEVVEEEEEETSDSNSCSDNDDNIAGDGSDDEADESDEENGGTELLSESVICYLRENRDLEELNLEECKSYLRLHGLRITGTKAECIQRIKEHRRIKNGNAEALYPGSSFTINCTGDVCKGDVVLFRQRVYKKFDKMTRSGSSIGTRTIAGRVIKESYGSSRQQHTFTIEVLWSKGLKKLPPLFPLLVKGRNLYRLKTFRQRWRNEAERSIILEEKHKRGAAARSVRAMKKANRACAINRSMKRGKEKSAKRQKHSSAGPSHLTRKKAEPNAGIHDKTLRNAPAEYAKSNNCRRETSSDGRPNSGRNQNPPTHGGSATWQPKPSQSLLQPEMQFHSHRPIVPVRFPCNEAVHTEPAIRFHPLRPYIIPVYHHQGASHQPYPRPPYFHHPGQVYNEHRNVNESPDSNIYGKSRPFHSQETHGRRNNGF